MFYDYYFVYDSEKKIDYVEIRCAMLMLNLGVFHVFGNKKNDLLKLPIKLNFRSKNGTG